MRISHWPLSRRLNLAFGALLGVFLTVCTIAYIMFARLEEANRWNVHTYQVLMAAGAVQESLIDIETGQRGFLLTGRDASLEPYHAGQAAAVRHLAEIRRLTRDNVAQQRRLETLQSAFESWMATAIEPSLELRRRVSAGRAGIEQIVADEQSYRGKAGMDGMRKLIVEVRAEEERLLTERAALATRLSAFNRAALLVGGIVAVGLGALATLLLTRSVRRQLGGDPALVAGAVRTIASGDLASPTPLRPGDATSLVADMERMRGELAAIIGEIRVLSVDVAKRSEELAAAAGEVTSASHDQMQSAASAATAVEEVTVSIDSITHNAESVRVLSSESLEQTRSGNAEMARLADEVGDAEYAVSDMARAVGEFLSKTAEITGMTRQVKDLADQTNLLALNAAIEAARAGEFGRGFAVVADEVRKLAERSGAAANEIDRITQALSSHSDQVSTAVTRGRTALEASRARAKSVVQVLTTAAGTVDVATAGMHEIVSSVGEQSAAATSIARSVEEVARMAEANHAAAARTEAAAAALQALSGRLEQTVGRFVVEGGRARHAR